MPPFLPLFAPFDDARHVQGNPPSSSVALQLDPSLRCDSTRISVVANLAYHTHARTDARAYNSPCVMCDDRSLAARGTSRRKKTVACKYRVSSILLAAFFNCLLYLIYMIVAVQFCNARRGVRQIAILSLEGFLMLAKLSPSDKALQRRCNQCKKVPACRKDTILYV